MAGIEKIKEKIREELTLNGYDVFNIYVRDDGAIIVDTISPKTGYKAIVEIPKENLWMFS